MRGKRDRTAKLERIDQVQATLRAKSSDKISTREKQASILKRPQISNPTCDKTFDALSPVLSFLTFSFDFHLGLFLFTLNLLFPIHQYRRRIKVNVDPYLGRTTGPKIQPRTRDEVAKLDSRLGKNLTNAK